MSKIPFAPVNYTAVTVIRYGVQPYEPCFHCKFIWKSTGNQAKIVLQNIHQDIARIWNLQDPKKVNQVYVYTICPSSFESDTIFASQLLDSEEFRELIAGMVTKLLERKSINQQVGSAKREVKEEGCKNHNAV